MLTGARRDGALDAGVVVFAGEAEVGAAAAGAALAGAAPAPAPALAPAPVLFPAAAADDEPPAEVLAAAPAAPGAALTTCTVCLGSFFKKLSTSRLLVIFSGRRKMVLMYRSKPFVSTEAMDSDTLKGCEGRSGNVLGLLEKPASSRN